MGNILSKRGGRECIGLVIMQAVSIIRVLLRFCAIHLTVLGNISSADRWLASLGCFVIQTGGLQKVLLFFKSVIF